MSLHQPVNILLLPSLGGREERERKKKEAEREADVKHVLVRMSTEERGRTFILFIACRWNLFGWEALWRAGVPQLTGDLYLQLLLMMRLHCRDKTSGGEGGFEAYSEATVWPGWWTTSHRHKVPVVMTDCNHAVIRWTTEGVALY